MEFNFFYFLLINIGVITLVTFVMLFASRIIARFKPSIILNFE